MRLHSKKARDNRQRKIIRMSRKNRSWGYARQSDPDLNPQFRRDWSQTTPVKRKRADALKSTAQPAPKTKKA